MRKNITTYLLSLVAAVILFSCNNTSSDNEGNTDLYFPLEKLVDEQVESLSKSSDLWTKSVDNQGKTETKKLIAKDVDWKTELALFYELSPNKKAYAGKFKIDAEEKEKETIITYAAEDLKLSMLTIIRNKNNSIRAIYGDLNSSNLFYHSHYELSFVPNSAFAIYGIQTLAFINSKEEFSIQWIKEKPDSSVSITP